MATSRKISSIVDVPKTAKETDLLGISKYETGLIEFIRSADTPITVAIQGEWGSGKTSLMNTLQYALCGDGSDVRQHSGEFYGIWINTWQYSLMNSKEETLVSIVSSISTQIMNIISARHDGLGKKALSSVLKLLAKSAQTVASTAMEKVIDGGGDVVAAIMEKESSNQTIKNLRDDLQEAIFQCLKKDEAAKTPKKGFLFFIDDLDRIDPPAAVQILELLKNIFDLEKCIFVLAIDYDVVVKGLKPKFGELTVANEREFRSFFDKIIQMPFSMPVASYSINNFLIDNLIRIGYLPAEKKEESLITQHITTFCSLSIGTNPRSLKRLLNTVSLITIISDSDDQDESDKEEDYRLVLNFALICIQIAYPAFYKALCLKSDFKDWNEQLARQLKLQPLSDSERQKLSESDEFNEEWEQVLYRICDRDPFLSNRALQISQLFNLMYKLIPEGGDMGTILEELLSLSAVTDVQAYDKPKIAIHKGHVLKSLIKSMLPQLASKIRAPWERVELDSKRIQSNVWLSYRTADYRVGIGMTVEAAKDHVVLFVWHHPWAFQSKTASMEADMVSAGFSDEWKSLKKEYQKLVEQHKGVSFKYPPLEKSGMARQLHVPHLTLQFQYPDTESMCEAPQLDKVSDVIADFMQINAQLRSLYIRYNETHVQ